MMNNITSLLVIVFLQRKWAGVQLNGYVDGKELHVTSLEVNHYYKMLCICAIKSVMITTILLCTFLAATINA